LEAFRQNIDLTQTSKLIKGTNGWFGWFVEGGSEERMRLPIVRDSSPVLAPYLAPRELRTLDHKVVPVRTGWVCTPTWSPALPPSISWRLHLDSDTGALQLDLLCHRQGLEWLRRRSRRPQMQPRSSLPDLVSESRLTGGSRMRCRRQTRRPISLLPASLIAAVKCQEGSTTIQI